MFESALAKAQVPFFEISKLDRLYFLIACASESGRQLKHRTSAIHFPKRIHFSFVGKQSTIHQHDKSEFRMTVTQGIACHGRIRARSQHRVLQDLSETTVSQDHNRRMTRSSNRALKKRTEDAQVSMQDCQRRGAMTRARFELHVSKRTLQKALMHMFLAHWRSALRF